MERIVSFPVWVDGTWYSASSSDGELYMVRDADCTFVRLFRSEPLERPASIEVLRAAAVRAVRQGVDLRDD